MDTPIVATDRDTTQHERLLRKSHDLINRLLAEHSRWLKEKGVDPDNYVPVVSGRELCGEIRKALGLR